jgi:hypothetical protein
LTHTTSVNNSPYARKYVAPTTSEPMVKMGQ